MDLPSFLWLWKIAAWSMGLSIFAYLLQVISGIWIFEKRTARLSRPRWLRSLHLAIGSIMVFLVLLLLAIGIVGTLGEYGSLGHSFHLITGLLVVALVAISAWSALQINSRNSWARSIHVLTNTVLFVGFLFVSVTGWSVVQKYLP
jgi:ABC-type amino acid transport system permease subunit